jgi:Cys-rich repeat protein
MSSFASSLPLRLCTGLALLVAPTLLGARGCAGDSHELCTAEYAPVCGEDGVTYGNACEADRAGIEVAHEGACELACYEIYAPVCGTDGTTYPNDCYAARAGIDVAHDGACACEPVLCDLYCEFGFATDPTTGCETCVCNPPPVCEPVLCTLYCEFGFATDPATGCETCACNPPPEECEPIVCDVWCEWGHAVDERGCGTCACNPPPPAECTSDVDCGEGGVCDLSACLPVGDLTVCGGLCRPVEPTICASDAECGAGERCEAVACPAICALPDRDEDECGACPPGICVADVPPPPPPSECHSDADCAEGDICILPDVGCACVREPCDCLPVEPVGFCASDAGEPSEPPPSRPAGV